MSGILGMDGKALDADALESGSALTDEQAEALGADSEDKTLVDDLGVPFWYPEDFGKVFDEKLQALVVEDKAKAALAGKRIPAHVRRNMRRGVQREMEKERKRMQAPVTKKEVANYHDNVVAPIGRQSQSLTYQITALRELFAKLAVHAGFVANEEEFNSMLEEHGRVVVNRFRVQAMKRAITEARAENGLPPINEAYSPEQQQAFDEKYKELKKGWGERYSDLILAYAIEHEIEPPAAAEILTAEQKKIDDRIAAGTEQMKEMTASEILQRTAEIRAKSIADAIDQKIVEELTQEQQAAPLSNPLE